MRAEQSALEALRSAKASLEAARADVIAAGARLHGVRADRAAELAEKLADDIAFVDRLAFVVEADYRAREAGQ